MKNLVYVEIVNVTYMLVTVIDPPVPLWTFPYDGLMSWL